MLHKRGSSQGQGFQTEIESPDLFCWNDQRIRRNGRFMAEKPFILIVDDSTHVRKALSAFLSTLSWLKVVREASDVEEALEVIESQPPDIVLMDVKMPAIGGLEATRMIKERWPGIKVIILTLYPDYLDQAQQAGADAFLVKGCSMEEISSTICSLN
jgi:DNA-binding NarL/FixJ family response regulator